MTSAVLASSMAFIDGTALNVVLPSLQRSLKASGSDIFWILNAYLLMLAALMLTGGSLGDRVGHKKVFMYGIFVFTIGSAIAGFSGSATWLILCRLLQGAGGAFMIPGSLSLVSSSIIESERGKAIGTWSSFTTLVTMGGPVLGGALADAGLWRYIFFINVPIGIAALLILWRHVEEPKRTGPVQPLDIKGSLTIAVALAALTYGILSSTSVSGDHLIARLFLIGGVILLIAFIFIEHKSRHPMMPLTLFSNKAFTGANLLTFFLYAALGSAMLFLSLNLVQIQGYNQLQSGMSFLPFTILVLMFARVAGKLADKFGSRFFLITGPAIAAAGLLMLSFQGQTKGPGDYWLTFLPGMLVFGLGMAFTIVPLTSTVMGAVSEEFSGVASGINNAITRIANVISYAIFGALAFIFFSAQLTREIRSLPLSAAQKTAVIKESANLGNASAPSNLTVGNIKRVNMAYHTSFIYAYRLILRAAALLSLTAALMALLMIRKGKIQDSSSGPDDELTGERANVLLK